MTKRIIILAGLLVLIASSALAQQTSISGKVSDSSGAVVVGASVTATRTDGGPGYKTSTNAGGVYQIPSIAASDYIVGIDANGFAKAEKKLTVLVGQSLNIDFKVLPATEVSTVLVESSKEIIDTTSSQVAGSVDPVQVSKLPLNGNNWQQLAVVVPGIRVNSIGNTPLTRNSSGTFQINVDGQQVTQSNEYSWKGEPQYSRDAIQEFAVTTNRFDATHGRSSAILINAQTKSGTNSLHGGAFGYFRDSAVNAADPVAKKVLPFSDQLYGGTLGGAIRKDKLFYFGSYEGDRNPTTYVTTPVGFSTWTASANVTTVKALARIDYKYDEKNLISLRASGHETKNPYDSISGTSNPSGRESWRDNSLSEQLTYTHTFSPNAVSDFRFGVNHDYYGQDPLKPAPMLVFPTTTIGPSIYVPTKQNQENVGGREDFYWVIGKHNIKLGAEFIHVLEHGIYGMTQNGQAVLSASPGQAGSVLADLTWASVFPDILDPTTWNLTALNPAVSSYTQTFGGSRFGVPHDTTGAWIQDDWKISRRLTLNLGLRYDNDFGLFNSHVTSANRAILSAQGVEIPSHGDNDEFGPRVGFAWSPFENSKTTIRGGVGIYYADMLITFTKKTGLLNGLTWVTPSVLKTSTTTINLADPFGKTEEQILANPTAYKQAIQVLGKEQQVPWSGQASIGFQSELPSKIILSADYLHNRSWRSFQGYETNVYKDPNSTFNLNPSTAGRPNSYYGSITTYETPDNVGSIYDALLLNLQNLQYRSLSGSIAYTLAKEKDNQSENTPFNPGGDWGPSVDNQTHTLNVTSSYQFRWGFSSSLIYHFGAGANYAVGAGTSPTGLGANAASGMNNRSFCGVNATYSGCPTTRVKTYNNPVNNYYDTASGLDIVDKDSFIGKAIHRVDINLAKDFSIGDRNKIKVQVEAFNALNHANYGAYTTTITNSLYGQPATSTDSSYWPRSLQFSARYSF